MATHVRATARELGVPFASLLEGGYDLDALAQSVAASLEAFADEDREPDSFDVEAVTANHKGVVGSYWPL